MGGSCIPRDALLVSSLCVMLSGCGGGSSESGGPPATPPSATPTYIAIPLGTLGGLHTTAYGINAGGQVVGASALNGYGDPHAFLYSDGVMTDLGTLGGSSSGATAINDGGQVTGSADVGTPEHPYIASHAFLYSDGAMTDLGTLPGGSSSSGRGINAKGEVTGDGDSHAFIYSAGVLHDLGVLPGYSSSHGIGINASGQVTGWLGHSLAINFIIDTSGRAFLYSGGVMADLGAFGSHGSGNSYGIALNASGQVTGFADDGTGAYTHAFLYSGGTMMDLGTLPGGSVSVGNAINDSGQVVGYSESAGGTTAILYSSGAMHDLNTMVTSGLNGAFLTGAVGINDSGQIAANSCQGSTCQAFRLDPIPGR
jgi:probable HAF family extracellular repeat protein